MLAYLREVISATLLNHGHLIEEIRQDMISKGVAPKAQAEVKREQGIVNIVGDPRQRLPVSEYFAVVDALTLRFNVRSKLVRERFGASGTWAPFPDFLLAYLKGRRSLALLRLAGWLYTLHLVAVIDVARHHDIVEAAFNQLEGS